MLEANDKEEEALPSSSTGPSKKRIREDQNDHAIGGMRNPGIAVARLHQVQRVGQQISDTWRCLQEITLRCWTRPRAMDRGRQRSTWSVELLDAWLLDAWRNRLQELLEVKPMDGITLKEQVEFASPLNAALWDAWENASRDPEQYIGQWASEGVPLGMDMEV